MIAEIDSLGTGWFTNETLWERIGIPLVDRARRTSHAHYIYNEVRALLEARAWEFNKNIRIDGKVIRAIYKRVYPRKVPRAIICIGGAFQYDNGEATLEDILA
jgi:hypothetical protein